MAKNSEAYGPFTIAETREFIGSVVGQSDSKNHRFDLDTVAEELSYRTFDAAVLWQTLEAFRLAKWDKRVYAAQTL